MSPISFLSVVAFATFLYQGVYVLRHAPRAAPNRLFALVALAFAGWAFGYAFLVSAPSEAAAWRWWRVTAFAWSIAPATVLHFFLALTGALRSQRRARLAALLYLPGLAFLTKALAGPMMVVGFIRTPLGFDEVLSHDANTFVYIAYYSSYVSLGLFLAHRWGRRRDASERERRQARLIVASGVLTIIAASISQIGLRLLSVHRMPGLAPILLLGWTFGIWYAMHRYSLFDLTPATAARDILSTLTDGLLLVGTDGVVRTANDATARLLARPRASLIGEPLSQVLPQLRNESTPTGADSASLEITLPGSAEARRTVAVTLSPARDDLGQRSGTVVLLRDISERRQLEQQLLQSKKMEAIGELAGGVAHDFNNILTTILNYADLLTLDSPEGSAAADAGQAIERAATRASDLTAQLLGFARSGKNKIQVVDLQSSVEEVSQLLRRTFDKSIRIETAAHAPRTTVSGDPDQLRQVLLAIAINARDAMTEGGTLTFTTSVRRPPEASTVDGGASQAPPPAGEHVVLTISDTGPGMDDATRQRVFEPFFTTKPPGESTGMGLAMAYGIIKNHEGSLSVQSEPARGTSFDISLPLVAEPTMPEAATTPQPAGGVARVLVVDDEDMVRSATRSLLVRLGYDVILAEDGTRAVELFRDRHKEIDLVLLDLVMPNMNGRDCLVELLRIDPDVRAILSTGFSGDGRVQEILDLGAKAFVQKPYRLHDLDAKIGEVLGQA